MRWEQCSWPKTSRATELTMATGREETASKKHQSLDHPLSPGINRRGSGNSSRWGIGGGGGRKGKAARRCLGVAAAALQLWPCPPASVTRRLPPPLTCRALRAPWTGRDTKRGMWPAGRLAVWPCGRAARGIGGGTGTLDSRVPSQTLRPHKVCYAYDTSD